MKLVWTIVVVIAWVGAAGAVFSPQERANTDATLATGDSAAASGAIFGTVLLWILFIMLTAILGKMIYDFFAKKPKIK
jgi:hypothetical protein